MNERTTLEKIAPTAAEAIAAGLAELGLSEDDVTVEVLDGGSRGIFGVGSRQARVRLTVNAGPSGPGLSAAAPAPGAAAAPSEPGGEDALLESARRTVAGLLDHMKITAFVDARYGEPDEEGQRPVLIDVHGDDLGVLIGRRAEILNALQYIVNLIVSKQVEHWVQIVLDVEGYRARRERQLRQMARRLADQALKTGRRQVLEPMNAAERRIVHLELREHPGVTTQSIGEEPSRKVTILPK
jgi:spoIIIJ-associated protein